MTIGPQATRSAGRN